MDWDDLWEFQLVPGGFQAGDGGTQNWSCCCCPPWAPIPPAQSSTELCYYFFNIYFWTCSNYFSSRVEVIRITAPVVRLDWFEMEKGRGSCCLDSTVVMHWKGQLEEKAGKVLLTIQAPGATEGPVPLLAGRRAGRHILAPRPGQLTLLARLWGSAPWELLSWGAQCKPLTPQAKLPQPPAGSQPQAQQSEWVC